MKKFASVLLAVLVAFSMFSFVVSAANPTLTATADKTTVKAGDVVTVTVKLSEKSGLGVFTVDLTYDASAFKVKEMTAGDSSVVTNPNFASGKARATAATATTYEAAITVCTVKLEALKAADSTIGLKVEEAVDNNFNTVTVATNSVAIKAAAAEEPTTEKPTEAPTEEPTTEKPTEAPSTEDPSECKHETMSNWAQTKAPTCQEAGVETRNCTVCGYAETRAVDKVACSYKWEVTKKATATENGEKVLKCVWCGDIKDRQILAVVTDGEGAGTIQKPVIPGTDAIA